MDSDALNFLVNLDNSQKERIWKKIHSSKDDPHRFFERLAGRKDYKLRVGDYRVIADIDDEKNIVAITLIGHRKNIYQTPNLSKR